MNLWENVIQLMTTEAGDDIFLGTRGTKKSKLPGIKKGCGTSRVHRFLENEHSELYQIQYA